MIEYGFTVADWGYLSFSEHRVVAALIKHRSRVDPTYYMKLHSVNPHVSLLSSSGVCPFNESVTCAYLDLDALIESCGLSEWEQKTADAMMQGYGVVDIAEEWGITHQTVSTWFNRVIDKVVKENNKKHKEWCSRQLLSAETDTLR